MPSFKTIFQSELESEKKFVRSFTIPYIIHVIIKSGASLSFGTCVHAPAPAAMSTCAATDMETYIYIDTLEDWLLTNTLKVCTNKSSITLITLHNREYNIHPHLTLNITPITHNKTPIQSLDFHSIPWAPSKNM